MGLTVLFYWVCKDDELCTDTRSSSSRVGVVEEEEGRERDAAALSHHRHFTKSVNAILLVRLIVANN